MNDFLPPETTPKTIVIAMPPELQPIDERLGTHLADVVIDQVANALGDPSIAPSDPRRQAIHKDVRFAYGMLSSPTNSHPEDPNSTRRDPLHISILKDLETQLRSLLEEPYIAPEAVEALREKIRVLLPQSPSFQSFQASFHETGTS